MSSECAKKPQSSDKPVASKGAAKGTERAELEILRQKSVELVLQKPEKAAVILSDWINGRAAKRPSRKKAG